MSRITTTVVTLLLAATAFGQAKEDAGDGKKLDKQTMEWKDYLPCLLYTSDAADE